MIYRLLTILLILLIFTRYLHIKHQVDQARKSGIISVKIRVFEGIAQKRSKFAYSSGGVTYVLPEKLQAKYGSLIQLSGNVGSQASTVTQYMDNQIILIHPSIVTIRGKWDSGILLLGYFDEKMVQTREKMVNLLHFSLPEPHSSIAAGMLLGVAQDFDADQHKELQTAGLLHVIAASGANLMLVLGFLEEITLRLNKYMKLFCLILLIWAYCFLAGFSPTIVRAAMMATFQAFCALRGNEYIGVWALFLSSLAMLSISPYLAFSISFQLSVAASFAMAEVYPLILKLFRSRRFPPILSLLEGTFLSSIAVSLVSLPLLVYHFESYSIISILSNLFMLWIVPYIMTFSAIFLVLAWRFPIAADIAGIPLWIFLEVWIRLTHFFANVPFALVSLPPIFGVVSVIPCFFAVFMLKRRSKYII